MKEIEVVNYVCQNHKDVGVWIYDKAISNNDGIVKTKKRIDLCLQVDNTILGIEIDQEQHKSYSKEKEMSRYIDIMRATNYNYIFIRYNPDNYKKDNILMNPDKNIRFAELSSEITKQITRIKNKQNSEIFEVVYLFYDDFVYNVKNKKININQNKIKQIKLNKYKCNRCFKSYELKGDYTRHINRKTPCDVNKKEDEKIAQIKQIPIILKNQCAFCNKIFS